MNNSELLTAISDILDKKLDEKVTPQFQKLDERLTNVEDKLSDVDDRLTNVEDRLTNVEGKLSDVDERLTNVEGKLSDVDERLTNVEGKLSDVDERLTNVEGNLSDMGESLTTLTEKVKNIELTMENELVPRVSHIEQCYLDTFERYQEGIDKLDGMQRDIDIIKITVTGHSEEINKITGPYLVK